MGLFGYLEGKVEKLGVSGEVTGNSPVGGIAGGIGGTVEMCYSSVKVSGSSRAGGIVGQNYGNIKDCYNIGKISGDSEFGSIVGYHSGGGKIVNCYYLSGTASGGVNGKDNGTAAKTEKEFKNGSVTYLLQSGQSEQVWGQRLGVDNYPALTGVYDKRQLCRRRV